MAKRSYEALHFIRMGQDDGELKKEGDIVRLSDGDAKIALERGIIRELSEAVSSDRPDPSESSGTANRETADNQADGTPDTARARGGQSPSAGFTDPNSPGSPDKGDEMTGLFGEDLAGNLRRGGYTSVEEVRGASEEELEAVKGIGKKAVERIRAALGEGGATGGI